MRLPPHQLPMAWFAAGASSAALCALLYSSLSSSSSKAKFIPSPLRTHAPSDLKNLGYSDDYLPGARDVPTPHGTIRCYEFGPANGRKVLLVHGITTPCVALAPLAEKLVAKGCRVLLFDLFGRGYTDAPADLEYDDRIYITQIFYVLASSPLAWLPGTQKGEDTGNEERPGFSLIGYSMGACIVVTFASYFPTLVEDIVLLAPAGLIRPAHSTWVTRLLFSGALGQSLTHFLIRRRLLSTPNVSVKAKETKPNDAVGGETAVAAHGLPTAFGREINPERVVHWQIKNHAGFLQAFISSFRSAPLMNQGPRWAMVAENLNAARAAPDWDREVKRQGLRAGKILMVVGNTDNVVHTDELLPDAFAVLGEDNLEVLRLDAGHEVPLPYGEEICEWVWSRWEG